MNGNKFGKLSSGRATSQTFSELSDIATSTSKKKTGDKTDARYRITYVALKRFLLQFQPHFVSSTETDNVHFDDFDVSPDHQFPWDGCLKQFFASRREDSRKEANGDHLVHKKTMALNLSAINNLYKYKKIQMSQEIHEECTDFIKGHANEVGTKRKNNEMPVTEGKKEFTFLEMEKLATAAVSSGSCFAWLFLLIMWSLIARSVSVSLLQFKSMSWGGDCIIIMHGAVSISVDIRYRLLLFFLYKIHLTIETISTKEIQKGRIITQNMYMQTWRNLGFVYFWP